MVIYYKSTLQYCYMYSTYNWKNMKLKKTFFLGGHNPSTNQRDYATNHTNNFLNPICTLSLLQENSFSTKLRKTHFRWSRSSVCVCWQKRNRSVLILFWIQYQFLNNVKLDVPYNTTDRGALTGIAVDFRNDPALTKNRLKTKYIYLPSVSCSRVAAAALLNRYYSRLLL